MDNDEQQKDTRALVWLVITTCLAHGLHGRDMECNVFVFTA